MDKIKKVLLIPIKNESWILESTLQNITPYVDLVIVADQNSVDDSVSICQRFSNVKIIKNPYQEHSNKVRWLLLEEARKYGNNNLIICIDADEIFSPKAIEEMEHKIKSKEAKPGDVFKFRWLQLWQDTSHYRNDGVWKNSYKNIAFIDLPGINEYRKDFIINDHTSRVPDSGIGKEIEISYPLLHFHFLPQKRNQMKQAWYRCCELVNGERNAKRINNTYRVTLPNKKILAIEIKPDWIDGLKLPESIEEIESVWHLNEILAFFDKYGVDFFEKLQIWHVPELKLEFIKRTAREPVSKTYPSRLTFLNELRHRFKILSK